MLIRLSIISVLFFAVIRSLYGQDENKNIYEIDKPLISCECNFENLFANWGSRFVTNHDSIKLISWNFVETLTDTARIHFYNRKYLATIDLLFSHSVEIYEIIDSTGQIIQKSSLQRVETDTIWSKNRRKRPKYQAPQGKGIS